MSNEKYIKIQIPDNLFYKLSDLAKEYDIDSEILTTVAIQKLLDDIDFIRRLRSGKINKL